jgi:hypothetical protein
MSTDNYNIKMSVNIEIKLTFTDGRWAAYSESTSAYGVGITPYDAVEEFMSMAMDMLKTDHRDKPNIEKCFVLGS